MATRIADFNIIREASLLEKESRELAQSLIDNDTRIQSYLLSEVAHIEEHRNPTRLNKFLTTLLIKDDGSKRNIGIRINAMVAFVLTFGNVTMPRDKNGNPASLNSIMNELSGDGKSKAHWNDKERFFSFFSMKKDRKDGLTKPAMRTVDGEKVKISLWDLAQQKPWFTFKPEDTSKPIFDFNAILKRAIKQGVTASLEAGKSDKERKFKEVKIDNGFLHDLILLAKKHGMSMDDIQPSDDAVMPSDVKEALLEQSNDNTTVTEGDVEQIVESKKRSVKAA